MFKKLFKKEKWHREDLITMARYNPDMDEAVKEEKRILRKTPSLSFRERIKMFFLMVLMFVIAVNPAWATNTHTTDLELDSSQYWSITDANQTGLDITGDISIEAWVKFESLPTDGVAGYTIVSKRNVSSTSAGVGDEAYILDTYNSGGLIFFRLIYSDNGTVNAANRVLARLTTGLDLSTSTWYHIAATSDVSEKDVKIYVNADSKALTQNINNATSIANTAAAFRIGAIDSTASGFFDGLIDDVRVWSDVRTPTEISANYNCSLAGDEANLVGYWRFDNNGEDSTSNNNDLTNNNSATFQSDSLPFTKTCGEVPPTPAVKRSNIIIFE
jgi:hypothetical protein